MPRANISGIEIGIDLTLGNTRKPQQYTTRRRSRVDLRAPGVNGNQGGEPRE